MTTPNGTDATASAPEPQNEGGAEVEGLFAGWPPLTSGPSARMVGTAKAERGGLSDWKRRYRLADVVCRRSGRRLVAVLGGTREYYVVGTADTLGSDDTNGDVFAPCRCGWDHAIDGALLASAVEELPRRARGVPTIFVDTVERLPISDV